MPDAITRRHAGAIVVQGSDSPAVQVSESQLGQMAEVTMAVIRVTDDVYGQAEEYIRRGQGNRSAGHHQRLIERAGVALAVFNRGTQAVQEQAFTGILQNRPHHVDVPRIIEVPQKGFISRIFS